MLWAAIYTVALVVGMATAPRPGVVSPPMSRGTRLSILLPPILAAVVLLSMTETITPTLLTVGLAVPLLVGNRLPALLPPALAQRRGLIMGLLVVLAFLLETGFSPSAVDRFGGLLLTVNVAFISIALCFPLGVLLALTRRSSFPLLRPLAVVYIELIRGVPLITLLFMGRYALGFFLPSSVSTPPVVISAIVMFTLFSAAYVAEIVRGGLQSVPSGQTEAGQAVGLSPVTITRKIVLPQALRNSIPALVGQFIALLKDTTLLIIISVFDLLGVSDPILASPQFQNQGYAPEVYAFVAFLFWVMCFSMSRASQRLETKLGVGTR
jgi:general L-amino acid transport system permease protein